MRVSGFVGLLVLVSSCRTPQSAAHHRFDDADAWALQFEDPKRVEWQKPDEVLAALQLKKDDVVADIGSATGFFPVRVAPLVPQGHVYGADVESSMVEYLNKRADREGLSNLTSHLADFDDPKIPVPVDWILIVDTYHHLERRPEYFQRLATSLEPGGKIAIIDFRPKSSMGPAPEAKVSAEQVKAEVVSAGYKLVAEHDFLPEQYFLVFSR